MRLALLCSNHIRHIYFAQVLQEHHDLIFVAAEDKGNQGQFVAQTEEGGEILQDHFASLEQEQRNFFGDLRKFPQSIFEVMHISRGGINSPEIAEKVKKHDIEGIAVFGCGILHEDIFGLCPGRVINAHQGISPYYRGSGTNFWPFVNKELQFVGVTIHYINARIDSGGIICHGRPNIEIGDSMHAIGCKTIEVSAALMATVFQEIEKGKVLAQIPQWDKGTLYQRKDFNAEAVLRAKRNMMDGMIEDYVETLKAKKAPKIQLIELK